VKMQGFMTRIVEPIGKSRRKLCIDEEPHGSCRFEDTVVDGPGSVA
jgi:hypothetical protein